MKYTAAYGRLWPDSNDVIRNQLLMQKECLLHMLPRLNANSDEQACT